MTHSRIRVVVSGRVQGVWFRDSTRREARARGVVGWVRNLSDGRVEALFEGEQSAVQALVDYVHHGPPHAQVEHVDSFSEEPTGEFGQFVIR